MNGRLTVVLANAFFFIGFGVAASFWHCNEISWLLLFLGAFYFFIWRGLSKVADEQVGGEGFSKLTSQLHFKLGCQLAYPYPFRWEVSILLFAFYPYYSPSSSSVNLRRLSLYFIPVSILALLFNAVLDSSWWQIVYSVAITEIMLMLIGSIILFNWLVAVQAGILKPIQLGDLPRVE